MYFVCTQAKILLNHFSNEWNFSNIYRVINRKETLNGCYLKSEQEIQWECSRCMTLTGREWASSPHTGGFRGQALIDNLIEKNKNKQKHVWPIPSTTKGVVIFPSSCRAHPTGIGQNPPWDCRWKEKHWLEEKTHMHGIKRKWASSCP